VETTLQYKFPDPSDANKDGLVAVGGNLSIECLLSAYTNGIFPWFNPGDPILWWSPDPRTVIYPAQIHLSRSTKRAIKKSAFTFSFDKEFRRVITNCAKPREKDKSDQGSWITRQMVDAYCDMFKSGYAHSVECWLDDKLCAGVYGVALGKAFFAESMFSRVSESSKLALVTLLKQLQLWQYDLLDCQMPSEIVTQLGAISISRVAFTKHIRQITKNHHPEYWSDYSPVDIKNLIRTGK